jgi:EAL domain-containing protein (putative c-di-GMP-specific phosphodiesterase class I)
VDQPVRSIIGLAHELGLVVVAEGIEDLRTWDLLARQGCDVGQGYFISQPLPAADFTSWLTEVGRADVLPTAA